jgi:hypothetical protein
MSEALTKYEIERRELARGRRLKLAAWSAPVILTAVPAVITAAMFLFLATTPPAAATILFLGLIITAIGFVKGLVISGLLAYKYANWTKEMRERIAADGIKPEELGWFLSELKSAEKRTLKNLERKDPLLADAYRETLASRLTATRIIRSSQRELQLTGRRQNNLRNLNSKRKEDFMKELEKDAEKLRAINEEAKLMLAEAESRLQMIESAALRGYELADSSIALKKLSARSASLPLALEEAKMAEEIRNELEKESLD